MVCGSTTIDDKEAKKWSTIREATFPLQGHRKLE